MHEVWLDEEGQCHGKEDLLHQHRPKEDLMQVQQMETCERMDQTPVLPTLPENLVPKGAPVSDYDSVVSSVYSHHSVPEEEFGDDNDGFIHIHVLPPLQTLHMREMDQILFLRDASLSRLLRELQYLLHQILASRIVVLHTSILLISGFVDQMEGLNVLISMS